MPYISNQQSCSTQEGSWTYEEYLLMFMIGFFFAGCARLYWKGGNLDKTSGLCFLLTVFSAYCWLEQRVPQKDHGIRWVSAKECDSYAKNGYYFEKK